MRASHHETLVNRLAQILIKLNQGDRIILTNLAAEFGVTLRTVQRDLNQRFSYLPLIKSDGRYWLDPSFLGKFSNQDIVHFANLSGVSGLFPGLSKSFLQDIFDSRLQSTFLVKGHHYESLSGKESLFKELELAIANSTLIAFDYTRGGVIKRYTVSPYKLVNYKGIWYLVGVDQDRIKSFSFTKIDNIQSTNQTFESDTAIIQQIEEDDGIFFKDEKTEIILKVSVGVAGYFKRRKLIVNQIIEKELADGGLILSTKTGDIKHILAVVRYWIPYIRILSPDGLQETLNKELSNYIHQ